MSDLVIEHAEDDVGGEFVISDGDPSREPLAELTYRRLPDRINILHTEVDRSLEGKGVGKRLVAAAVAWARSAGLKVEARCPFARGVLANTPAYADVRPV